MSFKNQLRQKNFSVIPAVHTQRSVFKRSFNLKDTFDFDYIVPIFIDEVVPGDTMMLRMNTFARLATQVVPFMDTATIDYHFFFVPNRLVWDNWERFCGAQDNPGDPVDFIVPYLDIADVTPVEFSVGSIYDKFGLPTDVDLSGTGERINALPFRGYNLIFRDWFRDENLQASPPVPTDDGPDDLSLYELLKRNKFHDYFTSGLPWPQKGDPVSMSMGVINPFIPVGSFAGPSAAVPFPDVGSSMTGNPGFNLIGGSTAGSGNFSLMNLLPTIGPAPQTLRVGSQDGTNLTDNRLTIAKDSQFDPQDWTPGDPYGGLRARYLYGQVNNNNFYLDVNTLRQGILVQSLLELDARGGTRYTEILMSHFNVMSPDFRLQRPEHLGSSQSYVSVHPVPQTSETTDTGTPQGTLSSFATQSATLNITKSFVEHGYVFGFACARGNITYQQGLNRMWSRSTRYDFFWPKLQELGEQPVYTKEIFLGPDSPTNNEVFCYQERYAEYKYKPSEIHGQFRSSFAETLDVWHLAEEFQEAPTLSDAFIQSNTPIERTLAVTVGYPHLLFDAFFDFKHVRPMMTYAVPATLGRF